MYNLGAMYYRGQGVGQNYVEAYKWRRLAADRAPVDKRQAYGDSVEAIIKVMTAEQLNEGVQRANDWATAFERELSTLDRTLPANSRKTAVAPIQTGQSFKSMTDVVEVETTVVDAGGRQVTDLLAREFQLKVDGHLRAVTSATYIAQPNVSSETSRMSTTERVNGGRYIVIAVDENNISVGAGHGAIQAAQRLVRSLPETDRVALFAVPTGTALDFTTDHARVLSALDRLVGRAPPSFSNFSVSLSELFAFAPSASPFDRLTQQRVTSRECHDGRSSCQDELLAEVQFRLQDLTERSHATLAALSALFSALSPMRGWKTVILISEGLALRPDASETNTVASLAARAATARVRLDSVLLDADLVDAADARLSPAPAQDRAVREDGLRDLTNRSDGTLAKIVGTANAAFDRLADELSGYYLLAFEVQEGDRDGRSHAIGVTTVRRGDTIRSRSRFVVPHP
jgi:VWFA-related protein